MDVLFLETECPGAFRIWVIVTGGGGNAVLWRCWIWVITLETWQNECTSGAADLCGFILGSLACVLCGFSEKVWCMTGYTGLVLQLQSPVVTFGYCGTSIDWVKTILSLESSVLDLKWLGHPIYCVYWICGISYLVCELHLIYFSTWGVLSCFRRRDRWMTQTGSTVF